MQPVLIVIHLLIVIALVGVVLIQRSEGGGLGIGGGSGFMTARGTRNALTRLTAILAVGFFLTSIILTVLQATSNPSAAPDLLDRINELGSEFGGTLGGQVDEGDVRLDGEFGSPEASSPSTPSLPLPDLAVSPEEALGSEPTSNEATQNAPQPEALPLPDQ